MELQSEMTERSAGVEDYNNSQNCPENGTVKLYNSVWCLKDVDGTVNSIDPDQTLL